MTHSRSIAIIGGGPAGLMAADDLASQGHKVVVFEAMPTIGRKFLLAGKSGLNITHSEDFAPFVSRFGASADRLLPALQGFSPADVRVWVESHGQRTFVGSSGRIFPRAMKASPLLRSWLAHLSSLGVQIRTRHRMVDITNQTVTFDTPDGHISQDFDAILLALGGASWPKLGSNAEWVSMLADRGVEIAPFKAANCGFDVDWSAEFADRFHGAPIKSVTATSDAGTISGEFVISSHGIEGSLVYAQASALRDRLEQTGSATLTLNLTPGRTEDRIINDLLRQDRKASFSTRLRKATGLEDVKAALLREFLTPEQRANPQTLAHAITHLAIPIVRPRPIAEAISSAGGIAWSGIDENYMLKTMPGVFVAGEMVDWEAPTGGYLLTACLATGKAAAIGMQDWLSRKT